MIPKSEQGTVTNLTTAAAVWFAAAFGVAIGFGWFLVVAIATPYAIVVSRSPTSRPGPAATTPEVENLPWAGAARG